MQFEIRSLKFSLTISIASTHEVSAVDVGDS